MELLIEGQELEAGHGGMDLDRLNVSFSELLTCGRESRPEAGECSFSLHADMQKHVVCALLVQQ